ncbi:MAG: nuclear transport factor 2 family protein [Novosphingobium sp.]
MDARELADGYFTGIRSRDIAAMVGKFAPDAVMILPDGREITGADALRTFYGGLFAANPPFPTPARIIVGAGEAAVEIEAKLDDGSARRTANFFDFDGQGRIARLSIYRRG